ncbi:MAG: molybdopterin molybdotransferase MoeA [Trueperaceae bacterium]
MSQQNAHYPTQISVLEAIQILQSKATPLGVQLLPLAQSFGHILAEDVVALVDHPSLDNSAMDGYACKLEDTLSASAASPVRLEVIADIPAGSVFEGEVNTGQAVSIYTGAPMPKGTNAVVPVEKTSFDPPYVIITQSADPTNVRPKGQDFKQGEVHLKRGLKLSAASVGLAASMGHASLQVSKRPRVGILATGDEVIEPGQAIRDGQVFNSNTYSIAGLVRAAGAEPVLLPNVHDDKSVLAATLAKVGELDLMLTTGGVSMGKYDFVRDLLFEEGEVHFWKVAMKPAGPVLFGTWHKLPILGLPGNPVSCMIAFLILAKAFLQTSTDENTLLPYWQRLEAIAAGDIKGAGAKENFTRVTLTQVNGQFHATTTGNQSSGVLTSMLFANALAIVPPYTNYEEGNKVEVIQLEDYV